MDQFDARRAGSLVHGGTFNGNPVAAAAGLATLRYMTPARYDELERLAGRLRSAIAAGIARDGLDARVDGVASIFQVFPGSGLVAPDGLTPQAALFLGLLLDGFHLAPRGMGALATPTTEADVDGSRQPSSDASARCRRCLPADSEGWRARQDSNLRPSAPEADALSTELQARGPRMIPTGSSGSRQSLTLSRMVWPIA